MLKIISLVICVFVITKASSQDKILDPYDKNSIGFLFPYGVISWEASESINFQFNNFNLNLNKEGFWKEECCEKTNSSVGYYINGEKTGIWFTYDYEFGNLLEISAFRKDEKIISISTTPTIFKNSVDSIGLSKDSSLVDNIWFSKNPLYAENGQIIGLAGCINAFILTSINGVSVVFNNNDEYGHEILFYLTDFSNRQLIYRFESYESLSPDGKNISIKYRLKNLHTVVNNVYHGKSLNFEYVKSRSSLKELKVGTLINESIVNYSNGKLNGNSIIRVNDSTFTYLKYRDGKLIKARKIRKLYPNIKLPEQLIYSSISSVLKLGYFESVLKKEK